VEPRTPRRRASPSNRRRRSAGRRRASSSTCGQPGRSDRDRAADVQGPGARPCREDVHERQLELHVRVLVPAAEVVPNRDVQRVL
jgi:hypothetical protein